MRCHLSYLVLPQHGEEAQSQSKILDNGNLWSPGILHRFFSNEKCQVQRSTLVAWKPTSCAAAIQSLCIGIEVAGDELSIWQSFEEKAGGRIKRISGKEEEFVGDVPICTRRRQVSGR
jgi:hypothetical protein